MGNEITQKIEALKEASLKDLQTAYAGYFPGKVIPNNCTYLWRRVAHRIQEEAFGGLSVKTRHKLSVLIKTNDPVNNAVLKPQIAAPGLLPTRDRRLPLPGTIITKDYKGTKISVKTLDKGFEYEGHIYKSLTAIAKAITGAHWNGFMFFGL